MGLKWLRRPLLGLCVVLSAHVLTAFQVVTCRSSAFRSAGSSSQPRFGSLPLFLSKNDTIIVTEAKGRVNTVFREISLCVQERYSDRTITTSADWSRFRKYVYRSYERLSLDQVQSVLDFLEELFPDDNNLRVSILQSSPRILGRSVETFLAPTADFLKSLYGSELFIEAISRNQDLLLTRGVGYRAASPDAISAYLEEQLGLSPSAISKLKRKDPDLFRRSLHKIASVVFFLNDIMRCGEYTEQEIQRTIAKQITRYPALLGLSVPNKLQPQLEFILTHCHFTPAEFGNLLMTKIDAAGLFTTSIEQNLKPTLAYLTEIVHDGPNGGDLKRCIAMQPSTLNLATFNIQAKVKYFDNLDPPSLYGNGTRIPSQGLAARMMARAPTVYSMSLTENIIPKVQFLAGVWGIDMSLEDGGSKNEGERRLGKLLSGMPSVLTLSLEGNIQPTFKFFNSTGYILLDSCWKLTSQDSYLARIMYGREIGVSLFNRLLPRWHFVRSKLENTTQPMPSPLIPLGILTGATDAAFCRIYNSTEEEYETFKAEAVPRLKFSSQFDTWLKTGRPIELD